MAHTSCMLDKQGYMPTPTLSDARMRVLTHTRTQICNTYCFSTGTVIRERTSVLCCMYIVCLVWSSTRISRLPSNILPTHSCVRVKQLQVPGQKLAVSKPVQKSLHCIEPNVSKSNSQRRATCVYPEPHECSHISILYPRTKGKIENKLMQTEFRE
jgi:hypothetical protein